MEPMPILLTEIHEALKTLEEHGENDTVKWLHVLILNLAQNAGTGVWHYPELKKVKNVGRPRK